ELEERVKELRTTHAKRESLKEKIIADRVQQLINNVDGMGWGYEPSNVMIPAAGSPLLLPPGQYTTPPGYVPVPINTFPGQPILPGQPSIPGQAASRAPRAYSPGTGDLGALPSSVPALSTTAAPAALLPNEATAPSTIEPADLSEPNTTPDAPPIDPNKEPAR
ncbi:MAG: hypothetical protein MUF23_13075, partial [Pirellula sp.]|nr:hypothetical protein [Pirellula sp.]